MLTKPNARCLVVALAIGLAAAAPGLAAWPPDGVPVATVDNDQRHPAIVSDGVGGAIIAWWDDRIAGVGVYAQRLDAEGNPMWIANGIQVGAVQWVTVDPVAVSDGLGGAYIIWSDSRDVGHAEDHLYAQRIGSDGAPRWAAGGVKVCPGGGRQFYPVAISDYHPQGLDTNGVIVVWEDTRSGSFNLFAQLMDMNGARRWGDGGVSLSTTGSVRSAAVATDGTATPFFSAGAIVAWETSGSNIRANWIRANGATQWGADGLAVCTATGDQTNPTIVTIGPRRAVIGWEDHRNPGDVAVFAQKVDNGATFWGQDGFAVSNPPGPQYEPQVAAAADGAFVVWADGRDPGDPLNHDIYAQRVDLNGNPVWASDGIPVCGSPGFQSAPRVTHDGVGGIYVVWADGRGDDYDLRAQHLNATGDLLWDPEGVVVCGAPGDQDLPALLLQGDAVLLAWEDTRNGPTLDVYAGRLMAGSTVALPEISPETAPASAFRVHLLSPNPQRGEARFAVELPAAGQVDVEVSDVSGRRVRKLREVALTPGSHVLRWDGRDASGRPVPSGVYFMRVESGNQSSILKLVRAR